MVISRVLVGFFFYLEYTRCIKFFWVLFLGGDGYIYKEDSVFIDIRCFNYRFYLFVCRVIRFGLLFFYYFIFWENRGFLFGDENDKGLFFL